jgi:hypothetical protein
MSRIDTELTLLRERISALEEEKRLEAEKKAKPLHALSELIAEKTDRADRNRYSKSFPLSRFYDRDQIRMLEPIYTLLFDIQERLTALERKHLIPKNSESE